MKQFIAYGRVVTIAKKKYILVPKFAVRKLQLVNDDLVEMTWSKIGTIASVKRVWLRWMS